MPSDNVVVEYNPSIECVPRGVGFTGGGGVANWWTPGLSSATGQAEIQFLDANGDEIPQSRQTYTNLSAGIGIAGLTRTAGGLTFTFWQDCPSQAQGYILRARVTPITIGRCGSKIPHAAGLYLNDGAVFDETLDVGQAFAWCIVAGAHGWAVGFTDDVGSGGGSASGELPTLDLQFGAKITNIAKASPGFVQGLLVQSVDTNLVYFQLFDRKTALAGGEIPVKCYTLGAGSATAPTTLILGQDQFGLAGKAFATGITWGISSTMGTYTGTADSAADFLVEVMGV